MNVGERVRRSMLELREERSWTQAEVASKLNISQRAYSHYEKGSRNISLEMLVDVARLYNVSVDDLVGIK